MNYILQIYANPVILGYVAHFKDARQGRFGSILGDLKNHKNHEKWVLSSILGGGYLGTAQNLGDDMWQGVTRYVKEDVRNKKWSKI